jgi:3-hydroxybutyryl-CoA dehydrogenase
VCDAETIDLVVKSGFGARMAVLGPMEQSDLVGLGLTLDIHNVLLSSLDTHSGPHPYLEDKVAKGEVGMASGKGFREWTPETADEVRKRLADYLAATVKAAREEGGG